MKHKYFKYYFLYNELMDRCSIFQLRKLLKAVCEYSENGFTTVKMWKSTEEIFHVITEVIDSERNFYKNLGKNGSDKRWKNKAK